MSRNGLPLRTTPLIGHHRELGAKIGSFAGYAMPITYGSITDEHTAVRTSAGMFDVSHMGRLMFRGEACTDALEHLVTVHTAALPAGHAWYGLILTEQGGVLDDVILYALRQHEHLLVVNAGNREAVLHHIASLHAGRCSLIDQTETTGMIALQGPSARTVLRAATGIAPPEPSMRAMAILWEEASLVVATTGYTGEDGVELIMPAERAGGLWERLLRAGAKPAGLGARDTLRLEMAYPLYGHELSTEVTPWQARLGWALDKQNTSYCGREHVMEHRGLSARTLVGLRTLGRGVPRAYQQVLSEGMVVGTVTSGTFSPSLRVGIALAYVERSHSIEGRQLMLASDAGGGRQLSVEVVPTPFYRNGSRRLSKG